ncbi:hypothetical protein VL10_ORF71 [Staphylococcus phage vB_SauM_VL10]|nr:hypothetical protein VL10_ORF71 [Staphylococcus phage vB_SauM_VL10]
MLWSLNSTKLGNSKGSNTYDNQVLNSVYTDKCLETKLTGKQLNGIV